MAIIDANNDGKHHSDDTGVSLRLKSMFVEQIVRD